MWGRGRSSAGSFLSTFFIRSTLLGSTWIAEACREQAMISASWSAEVGRDISSDRGSSK